VTWTTNRISSPLAPRRQLATVGATVGSLVSPVPVADAATTATASPPNTVTLVLYAGPQAPAASLLATAHGRLLLARTSRAHCWSNYSGHKPPNPNPSHQWSLHISRSLLNQASVELWRHRCREFKISPLSVAAAAAKHDLTATALPSFGCREPLSTIHVTVPKLGKDVVTATAPLQARPPWPPPR
jgi:hypothetical protein